MDFKPPRGVKIMNLALEFLRSEFPFLPISLFQIFDSKTRFRIKVETSISISGIFFRIFLTLSITWTRYLDRTMILSVSYANQTFEKLIFIFEKYYK